MTLFRSSAHILRTGAACLSVCLAASLPALAQDSTRSAATEKVLDKILAKEGISVGGTFRSQFLHSSIGGPSVQSSKRSEESVDFTSVDFDMRARPNTTTQGRVAFRMHQDWRNFFSDIGNPIDSRWISMDGSIHEMFSYSAGDFRQKYSPLTLYSPDINLMYEPALMATRHQEAAEEVFLGNNDRLLQGVNMNFDAAVDKGGRGLVKELHLNFLGSRLRNVETSIQNGSKVTAFIERSPAEKFLGSTNLDMVLPVGVSVGGSALKIFDKHGSYSGNDNADTAAQSTFIWAARAGLDVSSWFEAKKWKVSLNTEFAKSQDDSNNLNKAPDTLLHSRIISGSAMISSLQGEWNSGTTFGLKAKVGFTQNQPNYRNELAQSPSFIGERIMNIENDTSKIRTNDVRALNYSTFDAMYRHVFKFAPSEATNMWVMAPFQKLSYTNSIMTQGEMATFAALRSDPSVQLVMPFGPATANRTGLNTDITFSTWENRIEIKGVFAQLAEIAGMEIDSARSLPATHFTQTGGGLKLEVGSMVAWAYPITLSGSMVLSTAKNDGLASDTVFRSYEVKSAFLNSGARAQIWKRFALLGAYQQIKNDRTTGAVTGTQTQRNVGGGVEYIAGPGASVTATLDRLSVAYSGALPAARDFHQLETELFLLVHF